METPKSRGYRYFYVGLHLAMLFCTILFLIITVFGDNRPIYLIPAGISLAVLIFSGRRIYFKTGAWAFVHRKSEQMDERELLLARKSLQKAYAGFTIVILAFIALLSFGLSFKGSSELIKYNSSALWFLVCGFIYLAHSLPAAFVVLNSEYLDFRS